MAYAAPGRAAECRDRSPGRQEILHGCAFIAAHNRRDFDAAVELKLVFTKRELLRKIWGYRSERNSSWAAVSSSATSSGFSGQSAHRSASGVARKSTGGTCSTTPDVHAPVASRRSGEVRIRPPGKVSNSWNSKTSERFPSRTPVEHAGHVGAGETVEDPAEPDRHHQGSQRVSGRRYHAYSPVPMKAQAAIVSGVLAVASPEFLAEDD